MGERFFGLDWVFKASNVSTDISNCSKCDRMDEDDEKDDETSDGDEDIVCVVQCY